MPVQYARGIVAEHNAVRQTAGVFDISHMGRLLFGGPAAAEFLSRLLTKNVAKLRAGRVRYALITNQQGNILDDVLVTHLPEDFVAPSGEIWRYLLVVNASNRSKILTHTQQLLEQFESQAALRWRDATSELAMIAVQGPQAVELVGQVAGVPAAKLSYYRAQLAKFSGVCDSPAIFSRTGYTGEDGLELILPAEFAVAAWERILGAPLPDEDSAGGIFPAGLGSRDTLRLEAGMPLYGHELSEQVNPYQAGLGFAVDLDRGPFCGSDSLVELASTPPQKVRVGLELDGKRIAREGFRVGPRSGELSSPSEQVFGTVTSGTFSPTLQKSIAMAYVQAPFSSIGTELGVDIRGRSEHARVVELPFYQRNR